MTTQLNEIQVKNFLAHNNIDNARIEKIAGDASFRSYYRIFLLDKNYITQSHPTHVESPSHMSNGHMCYILMFAPPQFERIDHFIAIDNLLVENHFSAPKIFAIDEKNGFLLLEDFGSQSYSKVLANDQAQELSLYKNACDCLIELHKIKVAPPTKIEQYNHALLFKEVFLFIEWYLPHVKKIEFSKQQIRDFKNLWFDLFDLFNRENSVLVLRDFHADNLMVLQDRQHYKSVGLLDFQDAAIGSRAYDLVSLLEDARRDVAKETQQKICEYYLEKTKISREEFLRDYEILSLQRNIKILGIFARLANRDSKPHYLKLLPRVVNFVKARINSESKYLNEISIFLKKYV